MELARKTTATNDSDLNRTQKSILRIFLVGQAINLVSFFCASFTAERMLPAKVALPLVTLGFFMNVGVGWYLLKKHLKRCP